METEKEVNGKKMNKDRAVLVCVRSRELIAQRLRSARRIAQQHGAALEVVAVMPSAGSSAPDCKAIEEIYRAAKSAGSRAAFYFSDDAVLTLAAHIAARRPAAVVTGFPKSGSVVCALGLMLPGVPFVFAGEDGECCTVACSSLKAAQKL